MKPTARMSMLVIALLATALGLRAQKKDEAMGHQTLYRNVKVDGLNVFYREAGPKDAPTILLLHGLPSSSRMFEPLLTGSLISITRLRPTIRGSDIATGPIQRNLLTRSTGLPM